jgi:hypothetical protein
MLFIYDSLFFDRIYQVYCSRGTNVWGNLVFGCEKRSSDVYFFFERFAFALHTSRSPDKINLVYFRQDVSNCLCRISIFLMKMIRSLMSGRFLMESKHNFSSASWIIITCLSLFFLSSVRLLTTIVCSAIVFVSL